MLGKLKYWVHRYAFQFSLAAFMVFNLALRALPAHAIDPTAIADASAAMTAGKTLIDADTYLVVGMAGLFVLGFGKKLVRGIVSVLKSIVGRT